MNGAIYPVASINLKYGQDYKITFLEAHSILNELSNIKRLKLSKLRAERMLIRLADVVKLREGESLDSGFIMRDGQVYFMQGSSHTRIVQVAHNKDLHRE